MVGVTSGRADPSPETSPTGRQPESARARMSASARRVVVTILTA